MMSSINCLKAAFETYLPSRRRVVHQSHRRQLQLLLVVRGLHPVLLRCISEDHLCQILVQAVTVVAPKDKDALTMYRTYRVADLRSVVQTLEPASLMALMVKLS
jgi:hypothetical protein